MIITAEMLEDIPGEDLHGVSYYVGFTVCYDNGPKEFFLITSVESIVNLNDMKFWLSYDYDTIEGFVIDNYDEYGTAADNGKVVVETYTSTKAFFAEMKKYM